MCSKQILLIQSIKNVISKSNHCTIFIVMTIWTYHWTGRTMWAKCPRRAYNLLIQDRHSRAIDDAVIYYTVIRVFYWSYCMLNLQMVLEVQAGQHHLFLPFDHWNPEWMKHIIIIILIIIKNVSFFSPQNSSFSQHFSANTESHIQYACYGNVLVNMVKTCDLQVARAILQIPSHQTFLAFPCLLLSPCDPKNSVHIR